MDGVERIRNDLDVPGLLSWCKEGRPEDSFVRRQMDGPSCLFLSPTISRFYENSLSFEN